MRLRAEYRIGPELKFLANLDMMNVIGRTLRRAAIPYALSEGFNPHIKLSLGTVLPVGLWGEKEYFDLELTMPVETASFIVAMNNAFPSAITIKNCIPIDNQTPSLMKVINSASYTFKLCSGGINLDSWREEFLSRKSLVVKSRGKKKDLDKDLRPGIFRIDVNNSQDFDIINMWVSSGEIINVRYDELSDILLATGIDKQNIQDVYRSGNYIKHGAEFFSPLEQVN